MIFCVHTPSIVEGQNNRSETVANQQDSYGSNSLLLLRNTSPMNIRAHYSPVVHPGRPFHYHLFPSQKMNKNKFTYLMMLAILQKAPANMWYDTYPRRSFRNGESGRFRPTGRKAITHGLSWRFLHIEVPNYERGVLQIPQKQGEISSDGLPSVRTDDPSSPIVVSGVFEPKPRTLIDR